MAESMGIGPPEGLEKASETAAGMNKAYAATGVSQHEDILSAIRANSATGRDWWRANHDLAASDLEFAYVDQWSDNVREKRGRDAVELTLNVLPQHIQHVMGAVRQAKISIHIAQVGGSKMTPTPLVDSISGQTYTMSEIYEGLIRDVEAQSDAVIHYCNATQHMVESGIGFLRIFTREDPHDPFREQIVIKHILDRWSVLLDPYSDGLNFQDARWGLVSTLMTQASFERAFPGKAIMHQADQGYDDQTDAIINELSWWGAPDGVRVAEYFWKEPVKEKVVELINPETMARLVVTEEDLDKYADDAQALGYERKRTKMVDRHKVKWVLATYNEILKGPEEFPCSMIPIVPFLGREVDFKTSREFRSLIRDSHDPQRMINYWFSKMTERVALIPNAPYILTEQQIEGHEAEWEASETNRAFYLVYNGGQDNVHGKPSREPTPQVPVAEMTIMQTAKMFLNDTTGIHEPALGKKSNETSGYAIQLRQEGSEVGSYDFQEKERISVAHTGKILVDMVPRVFTDDQVAHIILANQQGAWVHLNHEMPILNAQGQPTGKKVRLNNLALGRYTCRVETGPAYLTQRREFVAFMEKIAQSDPEGFRAFRHLIFDALDVPNKSELMRVAKLLIPRHLLTEEEQAQMPEQPPTPEQQVEAAKAQSMQAQAESDVKVAELRVEEAEARHAAQEIALKIKQMEFSEAALEAERNGGDTDGQLEGLVRKIVAEALAQRTAA